MIEVSWTNLGIIGFMSLSNSRKKVEAIDVLTPILRKACVQFIKKLVAGGWQYIWKAVPDRKEITRWVLVGNNSAFKQTESEAKLWFEIQL